LHIHERLHTDGTFPNKSRASHRVLRHMGRRGKPKQSAAPTAEASSKAGVGKGKAGVGGKAAGVGGGKVRLARSGEASVARLSYIVQHRRTSSDEDDDEFTFHVHADRPTKVSAHYPPPSRKKRRRIAFRGRLPQGRVLMFCVAGVTVWVNHKCPGQIPQSRKTVVCVCVNHKCYPQPS